ncbi:formate--tetrahydrofolate ligase [bacterium BMS3Bbin10]|nr:formate--tetrahydrofolate ligase [bacterium BMS3Bbin10]
MTIDLEIARSAKLKPITEIASKLGIPEDVVLQHGPHIAKISLSHVEKIAEKPNGKLILVTAISPTPSGEGKTTTTVGLGDALNRIGKNAMICIREPSLGPVFGMKGGAAGGGYAQVVPMEQINLHFTGDFHAIAAANNLLAAMIDNHIYWGNELEIDERRIAWKRVVDMNDRALRKIVNSLGGRTNGFPREDGFDIVVASEVMAIFCLANNMRDLEERLGKIVVGYTRKGKAITASDIQAHGAMTVLLKDALSPNLVQTLENNPAFIHGGPFANIAHGCNSVLATRTALGMADYVVTEAGFGADLGAEKFFDIKCRKAGLSPSAVVLVATAQALKWHGGVEKDGLRSENVEAIRKGAPNIARHIRNLNSFGVPVVVAVNRFPADTDAEMEAIAEIAGENGADVAICSHWADGGAGAVELAEKVTALADSGKADFKPLYEDDMPLWEKVKTIATRLYGADDIIGDKAVRNQFRRLEKNGFGHLPVCMAKTQYSFSTDPTLRSAPSGHVIPIREVRLSAGAGFVVVIAGDIMTMPGLPREPASHHIKMGDDGQIVGLS